MSSLGRGSSGISFGFYVVFSFFFRGLCFALSSRGCSVASRGLSNGLVFFVFFTLLGGKTVSSTSGPTVPRPVKIAEGYDSKY